MSAKKPDLKTLLKSSSLPERAVSYVVDRALAAKFQRLLDELEQAGRKRQSDKRMSSEVKRIAAEVESVREQMESSTIEFTLRGMRAEDWRKLKERHPVGDDPSPLDQYLEADYESTIAEAVRLSMVDEAMPTGADWKPLDDDYVPLLDDEDWANFIGACTEGDWDRFDGAVFEMNEKASRVPFSQGVSDILRLRDAE